MGAAERRAVSRLHALIELLPTALDREMAGSGMTTFEFTVLAALHASPSGRMRLSRLASTTSATLPRLSHMISRLERSGRVARVACEKDGRATNAVLTDAEESVYRAARPRYEEAVRSLVLDGLDEAAVAGLAELSLAVLDNLDPEGRLAVAARGALGEPGVPSP
jgi:DNA-binding MarR family transcriptional regulator